MKDGHWLQTNNDSKTQLMPTVTILRKTICMVITGIVSQISKYFGLGALNNCEVEKYNDGMVRFEP